MSSGNIKTQTNSLRYNHRVTACRKRLRVNRTVSKVHLDHERVAFGETAAALGEDPAARESLANRRDAPEFRDAEGWPRVEQEVGST